MTVRAAQIQIDVDVLRMMLDLPEHLRITEVVQSPDDSVRGTFTVMVVGQWCPEWQADAEPACLSLIFRKVEPYGAELHHIEGLDT